MNDDRSLNIAEIIGGHGEKVAEGDFLFVRSRLSSGKEFNFAVPTSETHKLAELAFQGVPADARHASLEVLFSHLDALGTEPENKRVLAFGTDFTEVVVGDDGTVCLTLGFQKRWHLSFTLSRRLALWLTQNLDDAFKGRLDKDGSKQRPQHPFLTTAEDIEWFRDDWVDRVTPPTSAELRRASGTLRHLLINNGLKEAWRYCGHDKGPRIIGPDLQALITVQNIEPQHIIMNLAGGIQLDGIETACMSMYRTYNPETEKGPDADEGFAVAIGSISRKVADGVEEELDPQWKPIRHEWPSIERYMKAPGAFMDGRPISRRSILTYFAHFNGGVHLDRAKFKPEDEATYRLHQALDGRVDIFGIDGLHSELLAMGQAIGSSPDLIQLAEEIREGANRTAADFQGLGFHLQAME